MSKLEYNPLIKRGFDLVGGSSSDTGFVPIVVSGNITAANDTNYTNVANAIYTDPSPVEGKGYDVLLVNGTATIGGFAYSLVGTTIKRRYHSGSWLSEEYTPNPVASNANLLTINENQSIAWWGDSLTEQAVSGLATLQTLTGRYVYQGGVTGQTSTQIAARMLAAPQYWNYPTIFWVGRNNINQQATIMADLAAMVAALASVGNTNFLILSVTNGENEGNPSAAYTFITNINAAIAAAYPANYVNIRSYLVSQFNPAIPQDVIDHAADTTPYSLRRDDIHFTDFAYNLIGTYLFNNNMAMLTRNATGKYMTADQSILTFAQRVNGIFNGTTKFFAGGDRPPLGAELTTNGYFNGNITGWSGTNWSYSASGALHTTGSTAALTQSLTLTTGTYVVVLRITGATNGSVVLSLGGTSQGGITLTSAQLNTFYTCAIRVFSNGSYTLAITPTSNFNGSVESISVKAIAGRVANTVIFSNSTNDETISDIEVRGSATYGYNTSIGYNAGSSLFFSTNVTQSIGAFNTFYGWGAGERAVTTLDNTGIGYGALRQNTSGDFNTALGFLAGANVVTGGSNVFVGERAGDGCGNSLAQCTIVGRIAGRTCTGNGSTLIGYNSGSDNQGVSNTFLGANTGVVARGSNNVAVGNNAGQALSVSGQQNVFVGSQAGRAVAAGEDNVIVGYNCGFQMTGSRNTILGGDSASNTGSGNANILIGSWCTFPTVTPTALLNIGNVVYGINMYNGTSSSNTPVANGSIGIGLQTPTARLHLPAGTATAGTAPLKLTTGVNLSVVENGAFEYDGTNLYFTTGGVRRTVSLI